MATETLPAAHDREETDFTGQQDKVKLLVGAGQNAGHMQEAIMNASGGLHHIIEHSTPRIPVEPDRLHMTNTVEGQLSAAALIESGITGTVVIGLVPELHEPALIEYLGYAGEGKVHDIVIPKPFVQNVRELRIVREAFRAAVARRRQIDPSYDPETDPILRIQEHYKDKGGVRALRERQGRITERLGWLKSATIDIQEARTAEEEGRVLAFKGGALEDLGPHVISLGLDVQASINATGLYTIADRSVTSVERFRYEDSELPEDTETGFIIRGKTTVHDNERDKVHDLDFVWRGGKGLVDKKEMTLTYVHPDTHEQSIIILNLATNTITVPNSIKRLFPVTQFDDNGYGHSVEVGLSGGDPRLSFQPLSEAETVTIWLESLRAQGRQLSPQPHHRGSELR